MMEHTPAHDVDAERQQQAEAACLRSDQLETRALDWFASADKPAQVVDLVVNYFVESSVFTDWVNDCLDGEDTAA